MRVILLTGKGGVGKTSHAIATALGAAAHRHRVFLLSADPAHSLGDALGERVIFLPPARCEPSAAEVALCGFLRLERGDDDSLDDLEPIYLRDADAKLPRPGAI